MNQLTLSGTTFPSHLDQFYLRTLSLTLSDRIWLSLTWSRIAFTSGGAISMIMIKARETILDVFLHVTLLLSNPMWKWHRINWLDWISVISVSTTIDQNLWPHLYAHFSSSSQGTGISCFTLLLSPRSNRSIQISWRAWFSSRRSKMERLQKHSHRYCST
jgi:hypothetical protein